MHSQSINAFVLMAVLCLSAVASLTIKNFDPIPKPLTSTTRAPPTTTVSPRGPVAKPKAEGPIVVLQHHGTLDGPSGRFVKTEFESAPPVDLSVAPVFLPEFIPVFEDFMEFAASNEFERTENLAAPPVDLNKPVVFLPEATPIHEPMQDAKAAQQALLFVRG